MKKWLIPLILFILSFLLRISLISKGPYSVDCINLAIFAQDIVTNHSLHNLNGFGYPLTIFLGSLFVILARSFSIQDPIWAVNFMCVVFSSLAIPFFYLFVKKLLNETTALLSTILLSLCPIFLSISVYGMSHAPSFFFFSLGLLYFLHFLDNRTLKNFLISGIALGLTSASRLQDMTVMVIPLSFLYGERIWKGQNKKDLREKIKSLFPLLYFWLLVFLVATFFHLPFILEAPNNYLSQLIQYRKD